MRCLAQNIERRAVVRARMGLMGWKCSTSHTLVILTCWQPQLVARKREQTHTETGWGIAYPYWVR